MKVHGVRFDPQSVKKLRGSGSPIFVHGGLAVDRSDFDYIFRPLAAAWHDHVLVQDFEVVCEADGSIVDPIPALRDTYGPYLHDVDIKTQLLMLRAEGFSTWSPAISGFEGALLSLFHEPHSFRSVQRLYWNRNFTLRSDSWPTGMRSILHNWDGLFWQLFTVERADIDLLIQTHSPDPKLKMFFVDFDREFPDPSNERLDPVI